MPRRLVPLFGIVLVLALALHPVREESSQRLAKLEQAVAGQSPAADDAMFRGATVPIKPFAKARSESVTEQLGATK